MYLYIYIALLAVHTNQKHFQCEKPRQKRAEFGKVKFDRTCKVISGETLLEKKQGRGMVI